MSTPWAQARQSFRGLDPKAPWNIREGGRKKKRERREEKGGRKLKEKEERKQRCTDRMDGRKGVAPSHDRRPPGTWPCKPGSFLLWECYQDIKSI